MSWETARRQARVLEQRLDVALNQYSRVAGDIVQSSASASSSSGVTSWPGQDKYTEEGRRVAAGGGLGGAPPREDGQLEGEIERMLAELSSVVESLSRTLDDPMVPSSAAQQHALQRHREVLLDFERDYRRSRQNVQQARDRTNLLGSVKVDIDEYKMRHGSDAEALLAERSHLDNSHRMIDGTLDQAYATRADLGQQRSTLTDMTSRLSNTATQIPGLNNLIRLIHRRRQRDRIIMGCVMGTCTVLLLMYLTR